MSASKSDAGQTITPAANLTFAWLIALLAVGGLALSPGSGYGPQTLIEWNDQQLFLRAAVQTLEQGLPDAGTRSLVGPAYVGFTLAIGALFNLTPSLALILLSRITFVICAAVLALMAIRDRAKTGPWVQLAFIGVAILPLITSVWFRALDIPWTHFVAATLLGGILLVSLTRTPLAIRTVLVGALAVLLAQTRMFEAMVALIAGAVVLLLAVLRHWDDIRARPAAMLAKGAVHIMLPALAGGGLAFVAIRLITHNWAIYQQYDNVGGMVIRLDLAPIKAVQLFWDTCFATLCDFAPRVTVSPLADGFVSWRQPLLLQLPGLAAALVGLLVFFAWRPVRLLQLPLGVVFAILAAGGIILAYVSGAPSGSPHLKYGFFRDFIAPMVLLTGAFIAALATRQTTLARPGAGIALPMAVYFVVLIGLIALRPFGLPPFPGPQITQFQIASSCTEGQCSFALTALDADGKSLPYNDLAYVSCGVTPPVQHVSQLRVDAAACPRVGITPLATGALYTPEEAVFSTPGLDLSLPSDTLTVPRP